MADVVARLVVGKYKAEILVGHDSDRNVLARICPPFHPSERFLNLWNIGAAFSVYAITSTVTMLSMSGEGMRSLPKTEYLTHAKEAVCLILDELVKLDTFGGSVDSH